MDAHLAFADRLCRHAATVIDPAVRAALFRSLIQGIDDQALRAVVEEITLRVTRGDNLARVALLSLQVALSSSPARQRALLDEETAEPGDAPVEEDERKIPDYGRGRPLTLGERKSLARVSDRASFDRVLRDPNPSVIAMLLQNQKLTEADVVRLCARRPGVPEVLARVFVSTRWSLRPAVQRALAMNPATAPRIVAAVLPLLAREDMQALIQDERTPTVVMHRCEELMVMVERARDERMSGSLLEGLSAPDDAEGQSGVS